MAVSLLVLGALAMVFAVLVQTQASGAAEQAVPIDPNNAGPDTVLAEAAGVGISTTVRPASLTGLGYHPEGSGRRGGIRHHRLLPGYGHRHLHPSRPDGTGGQRRRDKAGREPGGQDQRLPGKERRRRRRQRPRGGRDDPPGQRGRLGGGARPPALRLHLGLGQPRHHPGLKGRVGFGSPPSGAFGSWVRLPVRAADTP